MIKTPGGHISRIFPEITVWERSGAFEFGHHARTAVILMPHPTSRQMNGQRAEMCRIAAQIVSEALLGL